MLDQRNLFSDKIVLELDSQVKLTITDKQAASIVSTMSKPTYGGDLCFVASFDRLQIFRKQDATH